MDNQKKQGLLKKVVSSYRWIANDLKSGEYKANKNRMKQANSLATQIMKKRYPDKPVKAFLKAGEWHKLRQSLLKGSFDPQSLKQYRNK